MPSPTLRVARARHGCGRRASRTAFPRGTVGTSVTESDGRSGMGREEDLVRFEGHLEVGRTNNREDLTGPDNVGPARSHNHGALFSGAALARIDCPENAAR